MLLEILLCFATISAEEKGEEPAPQSRHIDPCLPGVEYEFWSPGPSSPSYPANYDLDTTPVKD